MKVIIEKYNPEWKALYYLLEKELLDFLKDLTPKIEHIGSTSIEGLWAKPVVDIMVGIDEEKLDETIFLLSDGKYSYIKAFTNGMPERRFYIRMKDEVIFPKLIDDVNDINEFVNSNKLAHIHIVGYKSTFWDRHIAFREYLKHSDGVRTEYQELKINLSRKEWSNSFEFNDAKSAFIKKHESIALEWYKYKPD
jgi:GrpB-like predicted nucleotidyltransferase (UPF0157 family)